MRQRFEENRNVKDNVELTKILADSEKELFDKQHYQPIKCEAFKSSTISSNPTLEPADLQTVY